MSHNEDTMIKSTRRATFYPVEKKINTNLARSKKNALKPAATNSSLRPTNSNAI